MLRVWLAALAASLLPVITYGQTEPREGIQDRAGGVHALTGARVIVAPGQVLEGATILIRDGRIAALGAQVRIPADAQVTDMSGHVVTAGWIDLDFPIEVPEADGATREARFWNDSVRPERDAATAPRPDAKALRGHRHAGFTVALATPRDGVLAGRAALMGLGESAPHNQRLLEDSAVQVGSLEHGGWGDRDYPNSRMGAVALLRQAILDARWYGESWRAYRSDPARFPRPEVNHSLAALQSAVRGETPFAFRTSDALQLLTLGEIRDEFGLRVWFLGSGEEYTWLQDVARIGVPVVIPVDYPGAPRLSHLGDARDVTLRTLELWARAPENASRLDRAQVTFAFTPRGLKQATSFSAQVRKSIDRGLSANQALAAVTTVPARMLGEESRLGTVAPGKLAMLTVLDGAPFEEKTRIVEVWVDGRRYPVSVRPQPDLRGVWELTYKNRSSAASTVELQISGSRERPRPQLERSGTKVPHAQLVVDAREVSLVFTEDEARGTARLSGYLEEPGRVRGVGFLEDGSPVEFEAIRTGDLQTKEAAQKGEGKLAQGIARLRRSGHLSKQLWQGSALEKIAQPLGAFGRDASPGKAQRVLVTGATIWTCGPQGILKDADMYMENGKIVQVGRDLNVDADLILDYPGVHVTPGIIDAHSHTAIVGGVNEGTQAVTAEVRIGDVINPNDVNLYRQLAGGVTVAHLLHGSANPIGGQAATIKLRWGESPQRLKFEGAFPTIKFALGENVKQSNWGDEYTTRYPQTRMGVEQTFRDAFQEARDYRRSWQEHRSGRTGGAAPRRDLELEALVEILEGSRWIHCHSYRQDEILTLMRVAEDFGFRVGTFQHVLEGYKVAPEMARHGASGSSFSDWWAFKFEVYDAIPHNGALLHRAGVLTTFNSDSNELARRLNLEAAKAVKYGGVPPEEALLFVTLNAAKQLGIEKRVGSLEPGKDADFAIWSASPLSTYATCQETWIDGIQRFSRDADAKLRERDRKRRETLVHRAALAVFHGEGEGAGSQQRNTNTEEEYECCPRDSSF